MDGPKGQDFEMEELEAVLKRMKGNKAPGPDGLTPEIVKIAVETNKEKVLDMYNKCLEEGVFPDEWKVARLVLIPKGKAVSLDDSTVRKYRPICLLDVLGKILEGLILGRLKQELEADR